MKSKIKKKIKSKRTRRIGTNQHSRDASMASYFLIFIVLLILFLILIFLLIFLVFECMSPESKIDGASIHFSCLSASGSS
jgi:hypothetical protein